MRIDELEIGKWYTCSSWREDSYILAEEIDKEYIYSNFSFIKNVFKGESGWWGDCWTVFKEIPIPELLKLPFLPKEIKELYKNYKIENKINMKDLMLDVLNKTYDNNILRATTVPLFMSNPGLGKSTIVKEFADTKGVYMLKTTLSQRMPNEVAGGLMPNLKTKVWETLDNEQLASLKDGDIWFIDEVFNGTLKQTLDALLNVIEDRMLPSGKKLANIMIIAASNPQGLINLTPQIKERFVKYDLKFDATDFKKYLKNKYGIPENISSNICTLINKEKFESNSWDFVTPRSVEKAINQIGCGLKTPYDDSLLPYLTLPIKSPMTVESVGAKKDEEISYLELLKAIVKMQNGSFLVKKKPKKESLINA